MNARFNTDVKTIHSQPFVIADTVELSEDAYANFCENPGESYLFLEKFKDNTYVDENGIARCGLVLCKGRDDGILIMTYDNDYARYTSPLPCARQIAMLQKYPSLDRYAQSMARITDHYATMAVTNQAEGECHIKESSVADQLSQADEAVNVPLFLDMMTDRPEIADIRCSHMGWFTATVAEDYLKQTEPLRELTQEEVDVKCAKHTLWFHGADGGEQADFSGCLLHDINLSNRQLLNAIFDGATLVDVNMRNSELCYSTFNGTHFHDCELTGITAEECEFRGATVRESSAHDAVFTHSNFAWAKLLDSNAYGSDFTNCCLEGMDSSGSQGIDYNDESLSYNEEHWLIDKQGNNMRMEEIL